MLNIILYDLRNNLITDISDIPITSTLQYCTLYNNNITDIAPLANIPATPQWVWVYNNPVTYTTLDWPTYTTSHELGHKFNSTVTTAAEVDQYLIDFASDNWSNCTVYLDGTNPARTSASDAAVTALVLAGVILHLN